MRRLGRLGLVAGCLRRFLVNLKRRYLELYAGLEPELVARYLGKHASAGFSQVKPTESAHKLTSVCQEAFLLVERFGEHPEVAKMLSYRMRHRVLHEPCKVKRAGESGPEEITVKPARGPNRAWLSLFFLSKSQCQPSEPRLPTFSSPMYLATHLS